MTAEHGALLVVDEAHALGVVGPGGGGLVAQVGAAQAEHVVVTGTLSKSLAAQGGVVLASPDVRDHLVNTARPFIYDTGLAPASAGAALAALEVLADHPDLTDRVHANAARLAKAFGVPAARRCGHVDRDARPARSGQRRRTGPRTRHPGGVLPSTLDFRRVVATEADGTRRPLRARPRPGLQRARHPHRPPWLTRGP